MKDKYNEAYDKMYDMYPEGYLLQRFSNAAFPGLVKMTSEIREFAIRQEAIVELLRREIQLFEFEMRFPFRPDAKYFLITNFNNMIIKPILFRILEGDTEITEDNLRSYVVADIKTIMRNSYDKRKEDKISGHDVLKTIDTLWPQLQSTKMELWG